MQRLVGLALLAAGAWGLWRWWLRQSTPAAGVDPDPFGALPPIPQTPEEWRTALRREPSLRHGGV